MIRLILTLSWRMLSGAHHERSITTMIIISFLSIALGVGSLALVASIMNGFEKVTHEKMQNIHPQLFIRSDGYPINMKKLGALLIKDFSGIQAFAPNTTRTVIVAEPNSSRIDTVVVIKGVDPKTEPSVSSLHSMLIKPTAKPSMTSVLHDNQIMIGKKLAQQLNAQVGSPLNIFTAQSPSKLSRKITFDDHKVVVGGIFDTGIDEFDSHLIVCSLTFLSQLFEHVHPTEVGIKLKDGVEEADLIEHVQKRIGLDVLSWKELYPALVSALHLEKYVMFFLLALVTLVASMNLIALLFMQIIRKRKTMALLRTLGMPLSSITSIFYGMGLMLTVTASSCGLIGAFITGYLIDRYPFITLPDVYYVTQLPVRMSVNIFLSVFILSILLVLIALWIPIRTIKGAKLAHVLRFES